MGTVDGFDLSMFNKAAPVVRHMNSRDKRLQLRSDASDLFSFDFGSSEYRAPAQASVAGISTGGRVNGVAQWIALEMDEVGTYENRPGSGIDSCWAVLFYPLARTIDTAPGQEIRVSGFHDRRDVYVWTYVT
jgi:hypothetical protein